MPKKMQFESSLLSSLNPAARNARLHSSRQIHQIAASIREFGFTNPVLVDEHNQIIAGHGRFAAAKVLELGEIPIIRVTGLSKDQKRALAIADNKIALNAKWDLEILAAELRELASLAIDFDLELTGFNTGELDFLIGGEAKPPVVPSAPLATASVVKPGDVWRLGEHRIACGDIRDLSIISTLMGNYRARLVFADPPYNVPIDGHAGGLGSIKHREFAMASGEMSAAEFSDFLITSFSAIAPYTMDGALHFICMDWRHLQEMMNLKERVYSDLLNVCIWNKTRAGMGSFYRSKHELVFVFKSSKAPHLNNIELGKNGRYRTNVWDYEAASDDELYLHPTVKPIAMVMDVIKDCSKRGEVILDPFGGSGTTLLAAEKTKRRARIIEIDPLYVDLTIRRWRQLSGLDAVNTQTGQKFDEVAHG